jgi:hypothetical protein
MSASKIVALATLAAILYGIVHDLVTTQVSLEYFTLGHPNVFHTKNPFLLALGWGTIATWWVGLPLGCLLAIAAELGPLPVLSWRKLVRPMAMVLLANLALAFMAGLFCYFVLQTRFDLGGNLSPDGERRFFAVWITHNASYLLGAIGGMALCGWAIRLRIIEARSTGQSS